MEQKKKRWLNPSWLLLAFALFAGYSCTDDDKPEATCLLQVQLEYPSGYDVLSGSAKITLRNTITGSTQEKESAAGIAEFEITAGRYEVSASETRTVGLSVIVFNGSKSDIIVTNEHRQVILPLSESKTNQLVIKELYNGGCQKNDGSGAFSNDKYVILYNNSGIPATLKNLSLAMLTPLNATSGNKDLKNGSLFYEAEGWIPAGFAFWTLEKTVTIDPYQQIVIALNNAIDNTVTYSNSINFANPAYYATYDIAVYNNTASYSVSELIPTSNYLKAYSYGAGSAWPLSQVSPAFFIFSPEDISPADLATNVDFDDYYGDIQTGANYRKKIPVDWIVDGIEVFKKGDNANFTKRLTATVDAGYVELTNAQGHTLYRNVDKAATEAIAENAGKLISGYTSDPSGIDAEASIKNGARIIYKDTNNSTNDFHERGKASLRD
jgi:hypothetical protein